MERLAGKLEPKYAGAEADVFTKVLKALGGTKVTRQGSFVSPQGGCAVRCVHKADDGHLYPLEKAFFFLPKPPVLIRHDVRRFLFHLCVFASLLNDVCCSATPAFAPQDITEIAFERTAGGATGTSSKTFDIKLTTSNAAHRFSGIARAEYDNLVAFLQAKKLPVEGLATDGPRQAQFEGDKEDDSEDHYDARIRGEAGEDEEGSEEDADFKAEDVGGGKADSGGSPSDSSEKEEGEGGEGGDGGGDGAEGGGDEKKAKKPKAPAKRKEKEPSSAAVGKDVRCVETWSPCCALTRGSFLHPGKRKKEEAQERQKRAECVAPACNRSVRATADAICISSFCAEGALSAYSAFCYTSTLCVADHIPSVCIHSVLQQGALVHHINKTSLFLLAPLVTG